MAAGEEHAGYTFYFSTKGMDLGGEVDCHTIVWKMTEALPPAPRARGPPSDGDSEDEFMDQRRPRWALRAVKVASSGSDSAGSDSAGSDTPGPRDPLPLPDPDSPPASALWDALARAPWPLASERAMSDRDTVAFAASLARGDMEAVRAGFRLYSAALRSRGVTVDDERLTQLIAFGRFWVETAYEDPHLAHQIRDYQRVSLTDRLGL